MGGLAGGGDEGGGGELSRCGGEGGEFAEEVG